MSLAIQIQVVFARLDWILVTRWISAQLSAFPSLQREAWTAPQPFGLAFDSESLESDSPCQDFQLHL